MVTRRNPGRVDGHAGNGEENSETTPETDNPVLQRILQRMDQEQGQTHQQQGRARKGYDQRGRNFASKTGWADHQRPEPAGNYGSAAMTPLNMTRARILREVYQSDLIRLPPQAEGLKGPDMNKWKDTWGGTLKKGRTEVIKTEEEMKKVRGRRGAGTIVTRRAEIKRKSEEW
ncbi:hypothetical protein SESBI_29160 [Sesbania bispinosa]|nr:hypothetical protein SESBI_29160 [Sesbania bispinosa]